MMSGWWRTESPKELTLAEKLSSATRKTRSDLSARIETVTGNAKKVSMDTLSDHASSKTDLICTLNFDDPKFSTRVNGFDGLAMKEKNQVVNAVSAYIKEGGVDTFVSGNMITVKWVILEVVEDAPQEMDHEKK